MGSPPYKGEAETPVPGDRGEQQPEGDQEKNKDPPPAFGPLFLVENPLKSPSSPSDRGNSLRGWSLHWLYDSFPSLRVIVRNLGRQGGCLKAKWPKHHPWWQMAIREEDLRVQVPP